MSETVNTLNPSAAEQNVQQTGTVCEEQQKRSRKKRFWYILVAALGIIASVVSWYLFKPGGFVHPDFEPAALEGEPQLDTERYGYSSLSIDEGYEVRLCAVPANDGKNLDLFLTNPKENTIWLRAEITDIKGNLLAETGVLKQGEYVKTAALKQPLTERETPVNVKIIAYEPKTWTSRGNVNLTLTLYLEFQ